MTICIYIILGLLTTWGQSTGYDPNSVEIGYEDTRARVPLINYPLVFDVPAHNRLYLFGKRLTSVHLESTPGDHLVLNGERVGTLPMGWLQHPTLSEERLAKLGGNIPYVQTWIAQGVTYQEASTRYARAQKAVYDAGSQAYAKARQAGLSDLESENLAHAAMQEADVHDLVDWTLTSRAACEISMHWIGMSPPKVVVSYCCSGSSPDENLVWPEHTKRIHSTSLYYYLVTLQGPCWVIIHEDNNDVYYGEEAVREVSRQIGNAVRRGIVTDYPLDEPIVRQIMRSEKDRED